MQEVILCYLLGLGAIDLKKKNISCWLLYPVLAAAAVVRCCFLGNIFWQGFCGLLVGILLFFVSMLSREQLGRGDAVVFGILGLLLGPWTTLLLLMASLLLSATYSSVRLFQKRLSRKAEIPFLPFVFLGALVIFLLQKPV